VPNLAPAATAAFGQGAAAPAITGLPMFADFCNGSIQSQECKYHAGLDLADIVHKTYDVTVATVVVNVTQVSECWNVSPNLAQFGSPAATNPPSA